MSPTKLAIGSVLVLAAIGVGFYSYINAALPPGPQDSPQTGGDSVSPDTGESPGELSLEDALGRLTKEQRTLAQEQPTEAERLFTARAFALRDRLTGEPSETAFALRALSRYAQQKDRSEAAESMAFKSLGFLARAEAQVGIPPSQRQRVLQYASAMSESSDDDTRVLVAALLSECKKNKGSLEYPAAEASLQKLMKQEYVINGLPSQESVLESARQAAKATHK